MVGQQEGVSLEDKPGTGVEDEEFVVGAVGGRIGFEGEEEAAAIGEVA
jgi:hypothetical protein